MIVWIFLSPLRIWSASRTGIMMSSCWCPPLARCESGNSGAAVTLELSTANGQRRASGFSGCNRYMGTYALKDGKLSFGPLAGTRMACATPGGKIEGDYLNALNHIDRTGVQMRAPQQLQLILENGDTLVFIRRDQ